MPSAWDWHEIARRWRGRAITARMDALYDAHKVASDIEDRLITREHDAYSEGAIEGAADVRMALDKLIVERAAGPRRKRCDNCGHLDADHGPVVGCQHLEPIYRRGRLERHDPCDCTSGRKP